MTPKLPLVLMSISLAGLIGCSSVTQNPNTYARIQDIAMIGTSAYLSQKPQDRPELVQLYNTLALFNTSQTAARFKLIALLNKVKNGPLYASILTFTLNELQRSGVNIDLPANVYSYTKALRDGIGIALGLNPAPPTP